MLDADYSILISDMRNEISELKVEMAGIKRDVVHLSECVTQLTANLTTFMQAQQEINQQLTQNCNREERWTNCRADLSSLRSDISTLSTRMTAIEITHERQTGGDQATRPYKDYMYLILTIVTSGLVSSGLTYILIKAGLPG